MQAELACYGTTVSVCSKETAIGDTGCIWGRTLCAWKMSKFTCSRSTLLRHGRISRSRWGFPLLICRKMPQHVFDSTTWGMHKDSSVTTVGRLNETNQWKKASLLVFFLVSLSTFHLCVCFSGWSLFPSTFSILKPALLACTASYILFARRNSFEHDFAILRLKSKFVPSYPDVKPIAAFRFHSPRSSATSYAKGIKASGPSDRSPDSKID